MRILIIESSKTLVSLMQTELGKAIDLPVDWAVNKADALDMIRQNGAENYFLVITALNLADAVDGSIVEAVTQQKISTIVFSSYFDENHREKILKIPHVVDYVVKESRASLRYLVSMVCRLIANRQIKAMVVEDSTTMRNYVSSLLRQYQFQVVGASNGVEALEILSDNRDIKLIVTDYNMADMDGFELTKEVRKTYEKEELAIIGLSAADSVALSARFIKMGANDFLKKPFQPEEFFCRISQNMDLIEKTQRLVDAATKDFLTGLYNRRFFFEKGEQKLKRLQRHDPAGYVVMLDIDHFKSVNDTFGHDVGDEVLIGVSALLRESLRPCDMVARLGGEEFCAILENVDHQTAFSMLETIRQRIEGLPFDSLQARRHVTSSFGAVAILQGEGLDGVVKRADELLYKAKENGRNCVIID